MSPSGSGSGPKAANSQRLHAITDRPTEWIGDSRAEPPFKPGRDSSATQGQLSGPPDSSSASSKCEATAAAQMLPSRPSWLRLKSSRAPKSTAAQDASKTTQAEAANQSNQRQPKQASKRKQQQPKQIEPSNRFSKPNESASGEQSSSSSSAAPSGAQQTPAREAPPFGRMQTSGNGPDCDRDQGQQSASASRPQKEPRVSTSTLPSMRRAISSFIQRALSPGPSRPRRRKEPAKQRQQQEETTQAPDEAEAEDASSERPDVERKLAPVSKASGLTRRAPFSARTREPRDSQQREMLTRTNIRMDVRYSSWSSCSLDLGSLLISHKSTRVCVLSALACLHAQKRAIWRSSKLSD